MKIKTIMSQNVIALTPTDSLGTAMELMQKKRIRHLPIVNQKGEFLGLITHRDLLAASSSILLEDYSKKQKKILEQTPISKVMHKRVTTTTADADVRSVAIIMSKNKWGCLPVLDGKVLSGIVTASDYMRLSINLLSLVDQFQRSIKSATKKS